MRNLIGFNTPSKAQAQEEENVKPQNEMPMGMPEGMNAEKLKQETMMRLQGLGDIITTPKFNAYNQEQRAQILMDFAYFSKVADSL